MRLELDNDTMKGLVSEAIFQSFDEQKREALIKSALQYLLQPSANTYDKGKSPLQLAFEEALANKARQVATEAVSNKPEIIAAIDGLVADAMKKLVTDNREAMVEKLADGMRKAITGERY